MCSTPLFYLTGTIDMNKQLTTPDFIRAVIANTPELGTLPLYRIFEAARLMCADEPDKAPFVDHHMAIIADALCRYPVIKRTDTFSDLAALDRLDALFAPLDALAGRTE